MKLCLAILFTAILLGMLAVTTYASLDCNILNVSRELLTDPWFHATLADAYFGFITFYVWVLYKEACWFRRVLWFVLIMMLGNMAMAVYVLLQLRKVNSGSDLSHVLLRQPAC
ncbi:MAG: hypothetical protein CMJ78_20930 [Planctomycetaceae bacterium]|nr:hypothetical protein [Planctomycetaceae bacterium]